MVKAVAAAGGSGSKPPQHRGPSARAEAVSEVTIKTGAKGAGCEPGLGHRGVELDQVVGQLRRGDGLRHRGPHWRGIELDVEALYGASSSPARRSPARHRARRRGPLRRELLAGTTFTGDGLGQLARGEGLHQRDVHRGEAQLAIEEITGAAPGGRRRGRGPPPARARPRRGPARHRGDHQRGAWWPSSRSRASTGATAPAARRRSPRRSLAQRLVAVIGVEGIYRRELASVEGLHRRELLAGTTFTSEAHAGAGPGEAGGGAQAQAQAQAQLQAARALGP